MQDLLLVSNRLPVTIERKKGKFEYHESVGGLATGLGSFYTSYNSKWIGWCGIPLDNISADQKQDLEQTLSGDFDCHTLYLTRNQVKNFYNGFCNQTIWPILLYFPQYVRFEKAFWDSYVTVNRLFCEKVCEIAHGDEIIWIHDYHLMLLPALLRQRMPDARIGFFLHTSFPSLEIYRMFPKRNELLEGLLGADLIGFHTYDYVRHFLSSVHRLLGYNTSMGKITTENHTVSVDTLPIGIDYKRFANAPRRPDVQKAIEKWKNRLRGKKVMLSVDRLDYTKGIPQRLQAIRKFLERYPEYQKKFVYVLLAVPSRQQLPEYKLLKQQTDELVGQINGRFGDMDWMPIVYLYRSLPFHELAALYSISHVAIITSLRDGMNLVAKEYLAVKNERKGVLILSETTGAVKELNDALVINPTNQDEMVEALRKALDMPRDEQLERNGMMQKRLKRYGIVEWAEDFMTRLNEAHSYQMNMRARIINDEIKREILSSYRSARRRLLLLDYDGTLVGFKGRPEQAKPDKALLRLIETLSTNDRNDVIIISGRDKDTLEQWFSHLNLEMSAEHGGWIKERFRDWEMLEEFDDAWKTDIEPILESFEDRTPGSILERKAFSLCWHYRQVDSELGMQRVAEIVDRLSDPAESLNLEVARGDKVVEVKRGSINKGRVAQRWCDREDWDFILAIGDSWTDEDMFTAVPESAVTIKVGLAPSQARFNLEGTGDVRKFLKELADN